MTVEDIVLHRLRVEPERITEICRKWKISELSLFGSVLRDDFNDKSDVDVLVVFEPNDGWSLWDLMHCENEFAALFGRKVDLVEKKALRNPFRRHEILTTSQLLYAA
jgi:predicted nucleotidyltransferase